MLEISPDFKHFMGFCLGGDLTFPEPREFQVAQAFFELVSDKLRIFRVGDNVGGDKYHQLGFVETGGLGTKQSSYIGEVLQYGNP